MSGGTGLVRFAACRGIDAARPSAKLSFDPKTGSYHALRAVNADVAPGGGVRRRAGFGRVAAGAFHSLWSDGSGAAFAGDGDRLVRIIPEDGETGGVTVETLATGLTPGASLSFVAAAGRVYYANGREMGVIVDGVAGTWGGGPDAERPPDAATPPAGHLLERHAGRIFIAVEDAVYFTRGAGAFHLMDPAGGFLPGRGGRVRLLAAVADGLFVGTDQEVFFAAGHDPAAFTYRRVMDAPPIPGACLRGPGADLGRVAGRDLPDTAVIWADARGLCLGTSGGVATRLAQLPLSGLGHGAAVSGQASWLFLFKG